MDIVQVFGAFGALIVGAVLIVIGLLALLVPYFIYSINKNVQQIQRDLSRVIQRDEAKPTLRL